MIELIAPLKPVKCSPSLFWLSFFSVLTLFSPFSSALASPLLLSVFITSGSYLSISISCKNFIFFSLVSLPSINLNNFIFPSPRIVSNPPAKKNLVPSGAWFWALISSNKLPVALALPTRGQKQ